MSNRRPRAAPLLLAAALLAPLLATATQRARAEDARPSGAAPGQPSQSILPAAPENRSSTGAGGETGVQPSEEGNKPLFERATLLPDYHNLRSTLADHGLTIGLSEIDEVFGNPTGGTRQGAIYEGLTQLGLGLDTEKAFGWQGGVFNVTALQIHGRGLSLNNLDNNLNTVSSIEAYRGTLLFELWYEQALLDKKLQIRVGQLAADQEFQISQYANLFINHTFGWSTLPSSDLPSGGPAYPLATPGIRLRWFPRDDLTLLAGIFNANPAGPGTTPPQYRDPSGTAFRLGDGVFVIAEIQYALNGGEAAAGLPGTYKLGAWYNSAPFADQLYSAPGISLAQSQSLNAGAPTPAGLNRRGNYSIYAVADQLVWRSPGQKDGGIGVFARAMGAPGDRNLVNAYLDTGATWKGLIPGRDSDTAGIAFAYARISDTAATLDAQIAAANPTPYPIRRNESVLELTYQAQIAPWWQIQPTAQYLFNINGGILNPATPAKRLPDAAILGLRSQVTF